MASTPRRLLSRNPDMEGIDVTRTKLSRAATKGKPILAVAYLRMSSDKQTESIPEQRKSINRYAAEHGYRIVAEYSDVGISGDATEKRHEFRRMIADAAKGTFQAILVWDQDRFGRFDSIEAGHWVFPLVQAGVALVTLDSGPIDWSDFAGRVMYSIKQEGKHAFLRDLSRNVMRGKLAAAKRGEWMGRAPYGYIVKQKTLKLGPSSQVKVVRRIFEGYCNGLSIRGVCVALNADGIKSPNSKTWSPKVVRAILTCETYIGRYVWNSKRCGKYHAVGGGEVTSDFRPGKTVETDRIVFDDHHPAIINAETFDIVQQRLQERRTKTTPHRNGGGYAFTGIIRCGKCGGRMNGRSENGIARYQCTNGDHKGTCDRNAARQDQLLEAVAKAVLGDFLSDDNVAKLRDEMRRQLTQKSNRVDVAKTRAEMREIESSLTKAKRRLVEVDADMLPVVQDHIRVLQQTLASLECDVQAAETPSRQRDADCDRSIDLAMQQLASLRKTLEEGDATKVREFCQRAFQCIEVWSERDKYHGQRPFRLKRGVVHLRSEILPDNLFLSS
ncbi:hypothetical protein Mal52_30580 [Symmachiella dynata]|uniref:Recombinase n=1 Tax=Symmachiella dynata TaxID=2527995 RepID=A0A517ZQ20_9PLAN|nr:recombinase family protein [Symmachiella dynata]QDU44574.1 hypothetical protein Mal52_30580 [Symmachiella dynata]